MSCIPEVLDGVGVCGSGRVQVAIKWQKLLAMRVVSFLFFGACWQWAVWGLW